MDNTLIVVQVQTFQVQTFQVRTGLVNYIRVFIVIYWLILLVSLMLHKLPAAESSLAMPNASMAKNTSFIMPGSSWKRHSSCLAFHDYGMECRFMHLISYRHICTYRHLTHKEDDDCLKDDVKLLTKMTVQHKVPRRNDSSGDQLCTEVAKKVCPRLCGRVHTT